MAPLYVAPSGGELHVKAHKEALAQGGEFITVLWAMPMSAGDADAYASISSMAISFIFWPSPEASRVSYV